MEQKPGLVRNCPGDAFYPNHSRKTIFLVTIENVFQNWQQQTTL